MWLDTWHPQEMACSIARVRYFPIIGFSTLWAIFPRKVPQLSYLDGNLFKRNGMEALLANGSYLNGKRVEGV